MAGFKRTLQSYKPIWFLTFDGDPIISGTGIIDSPHLIDEVGGTFGILHDEHPLFKGYYCGIESLVEAEKDRQAAIRYGVNTRNPAAIAAGVSLCPCSYVEVPIPDVNAWKDDAFSMVWMMQMSPRAYDNWEWVGEVGNSQKIGQLDETVLRLGNLFEFYRIHNVHCSTAHIKFLIDDEDKGLYTESSSCYGVKPLVFNFNVELPSSPHASLCVLRYEKGVVEYIVDGNTVFTKDLRTVQGYDPTLHTVPNMVATAPTGLKFNELTFFLGGKPTNEIRDTSPKHQVVSSCRFDQMALFNKRLTDDEVVRLYRRAWLAQTMYMKEKPVSYIKMDDNIGSINSHTAIKNQINYGTHPRFACKPIELTTRIKGKNLSDYAIRFPYGGLMMNSAQKNYIDFTRDFTFEFSIKGFSSKRSAIMDIMEINGVNNFKLVGNSRNGEFKIGWCDIIQQDGTITPFNADILDDGWHRVILRYRDKMLDVYVDEAQYLSDVRIKFNAALWVIFMMGSGYSHDDDFTVAFSEILLYHKALNDIIIKAHTNFGSLYKIQGQITKKGVPHKAKIRAYSHVSGELLQEVWSDDLTGNYNIYLTSNQLVDLMLFDQLNNDTEIRAVGSIDPDYVDDTGLLIP